MCDGAFSSQKAYGRYLRGLANPYHVGRYPSTPGLALSEPLTSLKDTHPRPPRDDAHRGALTHSTHDLNSSGEALPRLDLLAHATQQAP